MKKIISFVLALSLLMGYSVAFAADMGVQVIPGPEAVTEPVSLDDLQLNVDAEIEGWGIIKLTSLEITDGLGYYKAGKNGAGYYDGTWDYYWSGAEAEFVVLYADILNTTMSDKDYTKSVTVKAIYDDAYEYGGWSYQRDYNKATSRDAKYNDADSTKQNIRWAISTADNFSISPMYEGHYIYGCTLPNAVINGKKSLKLIITIDGNEVTYYIRK